MKRASSSLGGSKTKREMRQGSGQRNHNGQCPAFRFPTGEITNIIDLLPSSSSINKQPTHWTIP